MDHIEQMLKTSLNREIEVPESVLEKAAEAFAEIKDDKVKQSERDFWLGKKQLLAVAAIVVIGIGLSFNKPVIAALKSILWGNHAGLVKAIDSGYDQQIKAGYIIDNGIETKITKVTVDKSRLALSIKVKFSDVNAIKKTSNLHLDLLITDDKGTVISGEGYVNQPISGYEENTVIPNLNKGELEYNVLLTSLDASIPQMHMLNVTIKSISLFDQSSKPSFKTYDGPWNNTIDLEGQYTKAEGIAYAATNKCKDLTVTSAEMLPTGFAVKFLVNTVDPNAIETIKTQLTDSSGKIYQNSGGMSVERTVDNKSLVSMVFEVSQFDKIDSFKLLVKCLDEKESIVTLLRDVK